LSIALLYAGFEFQALASSRRTGSNYQEKLQYLFGVSIKKIKNKVIFYP
jgi:hypothetical protein